MLAAKEPRALGPSTLPTQLILRYYLPLHSWPSGEGWLHSEGLCYESGCCPCRQSFQHTWGERRHVGMKKAGGGDLMLKEVIISSTGEGRLLQTELQQNQPACMSWHFNGILSPSRHSSSPPLQEAFLDDFSQQ